MQLRQQGVAVGTHRAQLAVKALGNKTRSTRGDVDVFAHQIAVDAGQKIIGIEVDVFVATIELGGQVVAQPLGVHAEFEVLQRVQSSAPALAHLFAVVHREKAMHKHFVGHLAATEFQDGGPKQGVEGDDVFANEVVLLYLGVVDVGLEVLAALVQQVFQGRQVTDGCVQPHIKVLARRVGNFDAKVGCVAADVPVTQAFAGGAIGVGAHAEPLFHLVGHFGLQVLAVLRPVLQKRNAARVGKFEEEVLGVFQHGCRTRQGGVGLFQIGGRIDRTAVFAVVAVLVGGAAFGAFALDEAVGQKHVFLGVEKLLDGFAFDQCAALVGGKVAQVAVDLLRQGVVFRGVGAVPVVKANLEAVEVLLTASGDVGDELLWGETGFFGGDHDGRTVGVVGTHKMDRVALHALIAHPYVGLDVLHHVPDVEMAIGVGQGGGDE